MKVDSDLKVETMNSGFNMWKSMAFLMILSVFFIFSVMYRDLSLDHFSGFAEAIAINFSPQKGSGGSSPKFIEEYKDPFLGGLLAQGFHENSCLSRYQAVLYRKTSPHKPSSYLQSRLRKYEDLHRKCGPHTESYDKAIGKLKSGNNIEPTDCNYVVWIPNSGIGNKMLTITSAFLYALLTNRVLLVDRGKDLDDIFCEPFADTSWLLPLDFPLYPLRFHRKSPESYGSMLRRNAINNTVIPLSVYLHLTHDYDGNDMLFFADKDQSLLQKVPWLIIQSNQYFIPSFFLMSSFEQELTKLFPSKVLIFHHLGRYLFHPSNAVWGLITRFYEAYLEKADQKVGIQIRVFDKWPQTFQKVFDQIVDCFLKENLLPDVNLRQSFITSENQTSKAVLITSLNAVFFNKLRNMYWETPTVTGEIIRVCQPSNEELQQTETSNHDRKALAEIYLLSLSDVLITSSSSTFGYVAQGLGGLKPWILYRHLNETDPNRLCTRAASMEPCFHAPPFFGGKADTRIDTGAVVPYIRHCEDVKRGVKIVEPDQDQL
ncbi:hypothetical protein ACHQM5_006368 [Ranunculus cassubicifolius]